MQPRTEMTEIINSVQIHNLSILRQYKHKLQTQYKNHNRTFLTIN